jgi:hypothetical protein
MTQRDSDAALTERERRFIDAALSVWGGPASYAPLPLRALGFGGRNEFRQEMERLGSAVLAGRPLTDRERARVVFFTELGFASDLFGAGVEFPITRGFSDAEGIALLRGIQRKLIGGIARLVFVAETEE